MEDYRDQQSRIVAELKARQDICDALNRYCAGLDRKDWALMYSAFHHDAHVAQGAYIGDIDGLVSYLQTRHQAIFQSMHFLGNSTIKISGNLAAAETYGIAIQGKRSSISGTTARSSFGCRYLDRFELRNSQWRIADRVVALDWSNEEVTAAADQDLGSQWITSRRDGSDALYDLMRAIGAGE